MSSLSFLAALPALLAIAGFVIYSLLGHQSKAQQITRDIIAKLRQDAPAEAGSLAKLGPRRLAARLQQEEGLRRAVNKQDFDLLTRLSRQEFVKGLVIYTLIAVLFVVGVAAFLYVQTRPTPTGLGSWHLQSDVPEAKGLAVDLDTLLLTWQASGVREDVHVVLENVQTQLRSPEQTVSSTEGHLRISWGTYREILADRELHGHNRIRALVRTSNGSQVSDEFKLLVGIYVTAIPVEEDSALWVSALIDNASIANYAYQAKVVIWSKKGGETSSFGDEMKNPKTVINVPQFSSLDFSTLKIAYFGPDDPRIVRTGLIGK